MVRRRVLLRVVPFVVVAAGSISLIALYTVYQMCCTYTIGYTVTGTAAKAQIAYQSGDGLVERRSRQDVQAALPWRIQLTSDNLLHRQSAYLNVQAAPNDTVGCEIWINDFLAEAKTGTETVWCGYDPERNPVP